MFGRQPLATRYVDSTAVPYVVVNPHVVPKRKVSSSGCKARVTYKTRIRTRRLNAVVQMLSGARHRRNVHRRAKTLGIPDSPRHGGVDAGVSFEFWPIKPPLSAEKFTSLNGDTDR